MKKMTYGDAYDIATELINDIYSVLPSNHHHHIEDVSLELMPQLASTVMTLAPDAVHSNSPLLLGSPIERVHHIRAMIKTNTDHYDPKTGWCDYTDFLDIATKVCRECGAELVHWEDDTIGIRLDDKPDMVYIVAGTDVEYGTALLDRWSGTLIVSHPKFPYVHSQPTEYTGTANPPTGTEYPDSYAEIVFRTIYGERGDDQSPHYRLSERHAMDQWDNLSDEEKAERRPYWVGGAE